MEQPPQEDSGTYDVADDAAMDIMDVLEPEESLEDQTDDLDTEGEELDDLDESDDEPEEDEETDIEDEQPGESYTVMVDGEEVQVTRDDLVAGYQRQADYTRKTQEVADQRKQLEQQHVQAQQHFEGFSQQLQNSVQQLEQMVQGEQNINWEQLMAEDPAQFIQLKEQSRARQEAIATAQQQQQLIQQQQQQFAQQQQQKYLQQQKDLLVQSWPEWSDPKVASEGKQAISTYLTNAGFKTDEIARLSDFRLLKLANSAMKYEELQKAKPNVTKRANKAPQVQKPQSRKAANNTDGRLKKAKRLKQTGSIDDAASLLEDYA